MYQCGPVPELPENEGAAILACIAALWNQWTLSGQELQTHALCDSVKIRFELGGCLNLFEDHCSLDFSYS